ncbi:MAG TPA: hypothetical protein VI968_01050 [archaeon]|nr:hypothetical protein [archaeon]
MQFKPVSGKIGPSQPGASMLELLFFTVPYREEPFWPYRFSEDGDMLSVRVKDGIERSKVVSDLRKHGYVPV